MKLPLILLALSLFSYIVISIRLKNTGEYTRGDRGVLIMCCLFLSPFTTVLALACVFVKTDDDRPAKW